MEIWKKVLLTHRLLLLLVIFYFLLHLTNLTLLPPYNDESIYIDWAWTQTHMPGHLYESLYDAKQPLMMWLFGFFENFFADPLFAGRFVSVIFGAFTLLGIYKVTKTLFNEKLALTAAFLYTIIPIFVFYNRQALMESAIACIGVWSFYALINVLRKPNTGNGIKLGLLLGIGFFIKTSSLLFVAATTCIILFFILRKRKTELVKPYFIAIAAFFSANILLFINPLFWQTFPSNSRYSYTLSEYLALPFPQWFTHTQASLEIAFMFVTPFVLLLGIIGIILMKRNKIKHRNVFLAYFAIALAIEIISARFQNQRYIVPFLPFLVISATYGFAMLWKGTIIRKSLVITSILPAIISTCFLILSPDDYIMQLSRISKYSNVEHVRGQMSGYGIREVMNYIKERSSSTQPNLVLFALNAGNPENAVNVYAQKDPQLYGLHIDRSFFPDVDTYDCFNSNYPVFFVTRYDQQIGLDTYFTLEEKFINPDQNYYLSIYTLKKNCVGKTLSLSDFYQPSVNKILQIRLGI